MEETRIALIGIIIENKDSVEQLNTILHDNAEYIAGRMGLPLKEKGINVISVVMDAPQNAISALSGKIGMLDGINSKVIYDRVR